MCVADKQLEHHSVSYLVPLLHFLVILWRDSFSGWRLGEQSVSHSRNKDQYLFTFIPVTVPVM